MFYVPTGDQGQPGLPGLPGSYTVQIPHRVQKRHAGQSASRQPAPAVTNTQLNFYLTFYLSPAADSREGGRSKKHLRRTSGG